MYKIVEANDLQTLEEKVNKYLAEGYKLVKGAKSYIFHEYEPTSDRTIRYNYFYQTLIKQE